MIVARESPGWSTLLGIASAFAATFAVGTALGWWLDGVFGTSPILVLLGIALGVIGGVCYTVVQFRSLLANSTNTGTNTGAQTGSSTGSNVGEQRPASE